MTNATEALSRVRLGGPSVLTMSAAQMPLPIAVLVSGAGTNLQALLDTVHGREAQVVAVASSLAGAPGAGARWCARRANAGLPTLRLSRQSLA